MSFKSSNFGSKAGKIISQNFINSLHTLRQCRLSCSDFCSSVSSVTEMFDKNETAATLRRDRSSCIIGEVHILMLKGQLISKGLFGILNSSKKTDEKIRLNYILFVTSKKTKPRIHEFTNSPI